MYPNDFGEPVDPPWSEVYELIQNRAKYLSPRSFLHLFDVQRGRTVFSAGFGVLGYPDNMELDTERLLALCHENQRKLLEIQTRRVYEVFLRRPELIKGKRVVYCNIRAFSDKSGQYWRVHQASEPMQYDSQGRLVRYLSNCRVIGPYNGEPFETGIYVDPKFPKEGKALLKELKVIKDELLSNLGFSKRQEDVIRYMAIGSTARDIAETMGIHARTVDKHRRGILNKGRVAFPLNDFRDADDVVRYLVRQWML